MALPLYFCACVFLQVTVSVQEKLPLKFCNTLSNLDPHHVGSTDALYHVGSLNPSVHFGMENPYV